jgi:ribosomal protein S18 acetylase RimI-like enzyme
MKIRFARVNDSFAISRVHIDAWKTTYRGLVPDHVLDNLDYEKNAVRWHDILSSADEMKCFIVAETESGQIVGFATGGPNRTENTGFNGELYAIYILVDFREQGIGKKLVNKLAEWLGGRKYTSMLVWVLENNPAKHFYEAIGGKFVGRKNIEIGGAQLTEISYGWSDISSLITDPLR